MKITDILNGKRAVLTAPLGADRYCRDAMATVRCAEEPEKIS